MKGTKTRSVNTLGMFDLFKGIGMATVILSHTAEGYALNVGGGLSVTTFLIFIYREALMSAFYQMAAMPDNAVAAIAIAVVGNVLVIVLEGLSAGIQSLRLNYYEFFTKYFTGHGIAFEPVGLKSRIVSD